MITPEETAELERLLATATPGPWDTRSEFAVGPGRFFGPVGKSPAGIACGYYGKRALDDAALIVFLRNHAPALLAAARQAEAKDGPDEIEAAAVRVMLAACIGTTPPACWANEDEDVREHYRTLARAARLADPSPNAGGGGA